MTRIVTQPGGTVQGTVEVPADKSLSHRAVVLGALAHGQTTIGNFLDAEDCLATLRALRALGVGIQRDGTAVAVDGRGAGALRAPEAPLDLGNAGTGLRLLAGVLASQPFTGVLTGDASLRRRPMGRIIEPLTGMGARIDSVDGCAPLTVTGTAAPQPLEWTSAVSSAQVKSAILLAGLAATGRTAVTEPAASRDHTERMLGAFGCDVKREGLTVWIDGPVELTAADVSMPGDFSSAAFFIAAAAGCEGSELTVKGVGINPTRCGLLEILWRMGAEIHVVNERVLSGEPVADIRVRGRALHGADVPPDLVPTLIDELPAVFVVAATATGHTYVRGAQELRVKESDRIAVMAAGLRTLGVRFSEFDDGLLIEGGPLNGGAVDGAGDHRIAMALAMAGLHADGPVSISNTQNVATSYPGFVRDAAALGLRIADA